MSGDGENWVITKRDIGWIVNTVWLLGKVLVHLF
jgi:hypothetical protein